jgi:hypothetical protein
MARAQLHGANAAHGVLCTAIAAWRLSGDESVAHDAMEVSACCLMSVVRRVASYCVGLSRLGCAPCIVLWHSMWCSEQAHHWATSLWIPQSLQSCGDVEHCLQLGE